MKEKWIAEMSDAMKNRDYNRIAELCRNNSDLDCEEYCPFLNVCDWVVGLTDKLPFEYLCKEK